MTSVTDLTRLLARIQVWQADRGKPLGRADAARRIDEAAKLLEEVSDSLLRCAGSWWQAAGGGDHRVAMKPLTG
jgi:hypothetical protein